MTSNVQISDICKALSNTTLISIDSKRQYRNLEFHEIQRQHRREMEGRLSKLHSEIASAMRKTFEVFRNDGAEVLQQWRKYTMNMDIMIEDALRMNVKKSLLVRSDRLCQLTLFIFHFQDLSRAINGDGKAPPASIFKVDVVLDGDKVQFAPTYQQLEHATNTLAQDLAKALTVLPRLTSLLLKTSEFVDYATVVSADKDCQKQLQTIFNGLRSNHPFLLVCDESLCRWATFNTL